MSFFVPSVHLGRSRPFDPDDPFSGRLPFGARRRPKRKKTPIPLTCNIPYMCQILMVSLTGLVVLISGVAMSVLGYYPGYFAGESAFNGTNVTVVQNKLMYYHIRNLAFVGPVLMGIGCFAMIVGGVLYFEFREKYFRDLPQDEIKTMTKQAVRNLLVDQFRFNYFRGIPIPPYDDKDRQTQKDVQVKETLPEFQKIPNIRKGSSISVGNSLAPMVSHGLSDLQRAHSTSTIPNMRPTVILSPLNLFQNKTPCTTPFDSELKGPVPDRGSLVNMFRLAPSSLSGRTSTTGVENPAYLSDNDSEESQSDHSQSETHRKTFDQTQYLSGSPSPVEEPFTSVIVHAASIHFPPEYHDYSEDNGLKKAESVRSTSHSGRATTTSVDQSRSVYKSCPSFKQVVFQSNVSSQEIKQTDTKRRHKSLKANRSHHKNKLKKRITSSHGDILSATNRRIRSEKSKLNNDNIKSAGSSEQGLTQCPDSVFSIASVLDERDRTSNNYSENQQTNMVANSDLSTTINKPSAPEFKSMELSTLADDNESLDSGYQKEVTKYNYSTRDDSRSTFNKNARVVNR